MENLEKKWTESRGQITLIITALLSIVPALKALGVSLPDLIATLDVNYIIAGVDKFVALIGMVMAFGFRSAREREIAAKFAGLKSGKR